MNDAALPPPPGARGQAGQAGQAGQSRAGDPASADEQAMACLSAIAWQATGRRFVRLDRQEALQ